MIALPRARLMLCLAGVFAVGTLAFELPIGELVHQRSELGSLSANLASVAKRNATIRSEIASLHQPSTIAAIAHEDYGLVRPGQRAYVVMPAPSLTAGAANSLTQPSIPAADLVPVDPALVGPTPKAATPASGPSGGLWSRMVQRLEFWRWSF